MNETKIPLALPSCEDFELRVVLDKSNIEVLVKSRHAAFAPHNCAAENLGMSLFTETASVNMKEVKA